MDKLGIEVQYLLTQIVNFTIMVVILTKLLYKPILKALEERKKKIEEGLKAAESQKLEAEKWQKRHEELVAEAREEARVIIENAKKEGKKAKEEILDEGKKEVAALKVRMEKDLEAKFSEMSVKVAAKTVDIAATMVKKLIPHLLDDKAQHNLIERELKKLEVIHEKD